MISRPFALISSLVLGLLTSPLVSATTYYVNAQRGTAGQAGDSINRPLQSLDQASQLRLLPGDQLLFAAGQVYEGSLVLPNLAGTAAAPIRIATYDPETPSSPPQARAIIDAKGRANGIWLANPQNVIVENLVIRASGGGLTHPKLDAAGMRCGVLVTTSEAGNWGNVTLSGLRIEDIFYEDPGFSRGKDEVHTANGSQSYGWGVRFINQTKGSTLTGVVVRDCLIENVSHTGIKFTTPQPGITDVRVINNTVLRSGGPGIQLSGVERAHFRGNRVDRSGSADDSRKWGRGSGLWTWSCTDILIEHNTFTNANGPGDSAGCHIDFNCRNVVVQYNLSARNAGGFIEILGDNFNCAYRYNVSVDDGFRVKGENGAFQEGKSFWLSGYVGSKTPASGPFNSYLYNNTIYSRDSIVAKIAVGPSAAGVLVANNIFCLVGPTKDVVGDQLRGEKGTRVPIDRAVFHHNLFLRQDTWPAGVALQDSAPIFGDPQFAHPGGLDLTDYIPRNRDLVKDRGVEITALPGDDVGLTLGLRVSHDILGQPIWGRPDLGAIEVP